MAGMEHRMSTWNRPRQLLWLIAVASLALVSILAASALSAKHKPPTVRISVKASGKEVPGGQSEYVALSANGRLAAFESTGNLVAKDKDDEHDVYVHNRVSGKNTLVSVKSNAARRP